MSRNNHRYHLLVLGGMWASSLQIKGDIEIPQTDEQWSGLTKFIKNRVDTFIKKDIDISFSEYIQEALLSKYQTK